MHEKINPTDPVSYAFGVTLKSGLLSLVLFILILYGYHYVYHNLFSIPAFCEKLDKIEFQMSMRTLENNLGHKIYELEKKISDSKRGIVEQLHGIEKQLIKLNGHKDYTHILSE